MPSECSEMTLQPKSALILTVGVALLASSMAESPPAQRTSKVKIEATELDRRMVLQKLNSHGADHGMKFEAAEADYDYRIVFTTGQEKASQGSGARAVPITAAWQALTCSMARGLSYSGLSESSAVRTKGRRTQ